MYRVATLATTGAGHIFLGRFVIQNQNIAQLCTVSQRLRQRVQCKLYLTCHSRSKIPQLSAVATLVTASTAQLLFGKYGIQDQEFLGYVPCRNACDSK
jgi:hypothetical protein